MVLLNLLQQQYDLISKYIDIRLQVAWPIGNKLFAHRHPSRDNAMIQLCQNVSFRSQYTYQKQTERNTSNFIYR